jgi:hypothetical protein
LQTLAQFPDRFQLAPGNEIVDAEIRLLIFTRRQSAYRALYTIVGEHVQILHIRRAARDWASPDELIID